MSFDFDPADGNTPSPPELDRIDTSESASDRNQRIVSIRIDYDLCDDSEACVLVCPEEVLERVGGHSRVVDPCACTECWICVENCASGAIEIT
jgi:ferredoxin